MLNCDEPLSNVAFKSNLRPCSAALSQTGGHGDFRGAGESQLPSGPCRCCDTTIGRVCDGVPACREAVRDEAGGLLRTSTRRRLEHGLPSG